MDNYLAIDTYSKTKKIKNIYLIDFNEQKLYCGQGRIKQDYQSFDYRVDQINNDKGLLFFSYFIPIMEERKFEKLLNIHKKEVFEKDIFSFLDDFSLIEWII